MHVVLVHPQIPQNTGSIARSCASLRVPLHIIEPIPFIIDEKKVRRAGLDYWPLVSLFQHSSWQSFLDDQKPKRLIYVETSGKKPYYSLEFMEDDYLVFGAETKGIPKEILAAAPEENIVQIPTVEKQVRSLNLSNSVSIVLFDACRCINIQKIS